MMQSKPTLTNDENILVNCAHLMSQSSPWTDFYFSYEECVLLLAPSTGIQVYAVQDGGNLLAFVAVDPTGIGSEPMLEYVCVAPESRGKGVGTQLVTFFEDVLFPGADNLYLFVSDINTRAKALYERLGYRQVGEFPDFNLVGQTEFLMRKTRRPRQLRWMKQNLE